MLLQPPTYTLPITAVGALCIFSKLYTHTLLQYPKYNYLRFQCPVIIYVICSMQMQDTGALQFTALVYSAKKTGIFSMWDCLRSLV